MLVSDLDDTMFGDDQASKAFKDFWERDARLRGSILVYNTGRALDKWLSLWKEKSWCLAAPDHLITSVGTKVFKADPDVSTTLLCLRVMQEAAPCTSSQPMALTGISAIPCVLMAIPELKRADCSLEGSSYKESRNL